VKNNVAEVSPRTDTTTERASYSTEEHKDIYFVDLPGYGTRRFDPTSFMQQFGIDSFDLYLCVFNGKFTALDSDFLTSVRKTGKPCIFVRNQIDALHDTVGASTREQLKAEIANDVKAHIGEDVQLFFTSCLTNEGLGDLVIGIFNNLADAKKSRWIRNAEAYSEDILQKKDAHAEDLIRLYAGLSAVNGLNPIPVGDVTIDIGILLRLFDQLRVVYGIPEDVASLEDQMIPGAAHLIGDLLIYAGREGAIQLLKSFGSRQAAKQASKLAPFIGSAIASVAGYGITYLAGRQYCDKCKKLARAVLQRTIKRMGENKAAHADR
jgi:GTP-binding protein EngB required for normal cell division/uncharacterized protein (DUF697 family)